MATVIDRIKWLIDHKEAGNGASFSRAIGQAGTGHLGNWLAGKSNPSKRYQDAICEHYGVTKAWLLGLSEDMYGTGETKRQEPISQPAPQQLEPVQVSALQHELDQAHEDNKKLLERCLDTLDYYKMQNKEYLDLIKENSALMKQQQNIIENLSVALRSPVYTQTPEPQRDPNDPLQQYRKGTHKKEDNQPAGKVQQRHIRPVHGR